MLWAGGAWAVVWAWAAAVGLALPIMIWVGGSRETAAAWLRYDAAWLVPLGFLPLWAIVPGTLVTVSACTVGVWRQALLRQARAPVRVVADAAPPGPDVLARVDELGARGFEPMVELVRDGDGTHQLVFVREGAGASVVLSWASPPRRSPASTLIRPQKARDVARSVAFGLLHPGACRGGFWERAEVAAELDAWAAGIHERLAAAEVARGAAGEADAGGPVR